MGVPCGGLKKTFLSRSAYLVFFKHTAIYRQCLTGLIIGIYYNITDSCSQEGFGSMLPGIPGPEGLEAKHHGCVVKVKGRTPWRSCKYSFSLRFFFQTCLILNASSVICGPFCIRFFSNQSLHLHGWVAEQKMGISITGGLVRDWGVWGKADCVWCLILHRYVTWS